MANDCGEYSVSCQSRKQVCLLFSIRNIMSSSGAKVTWASIRYKGSRFPKLGILPPVMQLAACLGVKWPFLHHHMETGTQGIITNANTLASIIAV